MAYHADGFPGGIQRVERIQRGVQRLAVERAETFIQEQRIDSRFVAHQVRKCQRQRQTDEEAFAARKRAGIAYGIGLPGINHLQLQCVADFTLQKIAPVQAVKLLVSEPDQIIQRQTLGEFTELVAGAGAYQRIQITPVLGQT